jgi:hypothetical protein
MIEPEETIESKIVAALVAANVPLAVIGALAPAPEGEEKTAPLSQVYVAADVASQDMDWIGPGVPFTYTVRVSVHVAFADDKTGALFRDSARIVRGALAALNGDGCAALEGDGFYCDSFTLDGTSTALEAMGDGEGMTKSYTATVKGRFNPPTETGEED